MKINFILTFSFMALFLIVSPAAGFSLKITEVMYAPQERYEWLELFNPAEQPVNLTGWLLTDNKNTDELVCCSFNLNCSLELASHQFALVLEQDDFISGNNSAGAVLICVDDNSLGNGLGNNGDNLTLHTDNYQFILQYSSSQGANKNGLSLEEENGSWRESYLLGGTPGRANSQPSAEALLLRINTSSAISNNASLLSSSSVLSNGSIITAELPASALSQETKNSQQSEEESEESPVNAKPKAINPPYEFNHLQKPAQAGSTLTVKFKIFAGSSRHDFSAWSYLYRGNRCYSCGNSERESNLQQVYLEANQEKTLVFKLGLPPEMESGEYYLKVRVIKDDQKTSSDFKEKIMVEETELAITSLEALSGNKTNIPPEEETNIDKTYLDKSAHSETAILSAAGVSLLAQAQGHNLSAEIDGDMAAAAKELLPAIAYESKNQKIIRLIPYLLAVSAGLIAIIFVLKKN